MGGCEKEPMKATAIRKIYIEHDDSSGPDIMTTSTPPPPPPPFSVLFLRDCFFAFIIIFFKCRFFFDSGCLWVLGEIRICMFARACGCVCPCVLGGRGEGGSCVGVREMSV